MGGTVFTVIISSARNVTMVSQRWEGAEIDFGYKGGGEICTFYTILRPTGCDVEGLNSEVGA